MSDASHPFGTSRDGDGSQELSAVISAADAWNCHCASACSTYDAARCLYARTLEELSGGRNGRALANTMIGPLAIVVAGVRSVEGQALCQDYIRALESGDQVSALEICQLLIEMAQGNRQRGWDDLPGHV